ncbi:hypothetical protein DAPPUDRAFT_120688 [Daphnia pulex]|uniref:Uncharacterized protein n=1 Tax=Daphnia pulex TaxID=6669 RepID=E9I200_DAPPU|nr:hypothetical protein DAPPUDRAFT_120688 [Daphnia pulex]|eukprot:EFX61980.1 hypothetical protein DAPPUDRAFT_120688 [Daphnia pulex]
MNSIVQVVDVHSSPSTSVDIVDIEHYNSIVHVVDVHPPPTTSLETVDSEHCNSFSRPDDESLLVPCNNDLAIEKVSSKFLDKALRTREYSEISKKLRSFSGYEKLEKLDKTPPHKFWAHGRSARLEVSQIPTTSSPQTSPSQHTSSLNSSFRKSPVGSFTNRVAHFLRKRTFDGSEVSQSHTPNISERSGEQDCTVSSPNQSASISCFGSKERTGAEEEFPIGQSASLGTTDSVVAGSPGLGNESNLDRINGVDGIDARSGRAEREEESPEETIRACSDSSGDRLTVATLSGDLARAENIQKIGSYLTEVNKITPVQPLRSEIARLSSRLNHLPPLRNRSQALVQLGNIRLREAKETLRQVLALTTRPAEENSQQIGRRIRRNRGPQRRIPVQSIGFRLRITFVQPGQRRGILE